MSRVVVTGAAGFVGSHLAEALLDDGYEVVGIDAFVPYYPRSFKEQNLAGLRERDGFRLVEADLRSADLVPLLDGADAVVNEAAMAGLVRSWVDLETYTGCNLLAVHRLLDACREAGVRRFLQISTSSVYGTNAIGDESTPTRPSSPYGITKLAAEHLVLAHVELHGLDASILRYFSLYGPRQRPDMAYHLFIEAMLDGRALTIYGDGEQSRTNTFIADAVRGTIDALHGAVAGEVYNIGGGLSITLNEAIATIADELGVEPRIERGSARTGDQRHTAADVSKASAAFGYRPTVGPREGLASQIAWHQARRVA